MSESVGESQPLIPGNDRNRRLSIQAIYKDKNLSAQEKNRRMQGLMKGDNDAPAARISLVDSGREPSSLGLAGFINQPPSAISEEETSKPAAAPASAIPPAGTTMDANARKRAIKSIYLDNTLTGQEKQRRIQAIMGTPATTTTTTTTANSTATTAAKSVATTATAPEKLQAPAEAAVEEVLPKEASKEPPVEKEVPKAVLSEEAPKEAPVKKEVPKEAAIQEEVPIEAPLSPKPAPRKQRSPPPSPPKGEEGGKQRKQIAAIYKDSSLTALEKQRRVKDIIATPPPPPPPPPPPVQEEETEVEPPEAPTPPEPKSPPPPPVVAAKAAGAGALGAAAVVASQKDPEPLEVPPTKYNPAANRRSIIVGVHKDSSLTAKQKQQKIQNIMKAGAVTGNARGPDVLDESTAMDEILKKSKEEEAAPKPAPTPEPEPAPAAPKPAPVPTPAPVEAPKPAPAARKPARKPALVPTPAPVQAPEPAPIPEPAAPPVDDAAAARRKAIVAIHKDISLTPAQKQRKIQEIMKGEVIPENAYGVASVAPATAPVAPNPPPVPVNPSKRRTLTNSANREKSVRMIPIQDFQETGKIEDDLASLVTNSTMSTGQATDEVDAIQDIVNDKSMSAVEKYRKIHELVEIVDAEKSENKPKKRSNRSKKRRSGSGGAPLRTVTIAPQAGQNDDSSEDDKPPSTSIAAPAAAVAAVGLGAAATAASMAPAPAPRVVQPAAAAAAAPPSPTPKEKAASMQRKAIQAVYRDQSLSAQEKHKRVQALMAGKSVPAPAPAPSPAPAAAAAAVGGATAAAVSRGPRPPVQPQPADTNDDASTSDRSGSLADDSFADEPEVAARSNSRSPSSRSQSGSRSVSESSYSSHSGSSRGSRSYSSRSGSRSYSSRSGSRSDSRSHSGSSSYTRSNESEFSDEADMQEEMLIDAPVAVAKPEDMRLFPTAVPGYANKPPGAFVDEDTDSEYEDRGNPKRRLICCVILTLVILGAVGGPLLATYWTEVSEWWDELVSPSAPATQEEDSFAPTGLPTTISPTMVPSGAPTTLYPPNTPEQCAIIADGGTVDGQEDLLSKSFDITMDVSLTLLLSDLTEVVEELELRMQRILSVDLADCLSISRRLMISTTFNRRKLIELHVVGNVLIDAVYLEDQNCSPSAPTPCIKVLTRLNFLLKGDESELTLINRISNLFEQVEVIDLLGLTTLFKEVEISGLTASTPTAPPAVVETDSPTQAPTQPLPTVTTASPTKAPTKSPTPAPTKSPTPAPTSTFAPTVGREVDVEAALETLGDLDDLVDDAVEWLLEDDGWVPDNWRPPTPSIWLQRYALAVLYEENRGWGWDEDDNWLDDDKSICDWYGVSCDGNNDIASLELNNNNIDGEIPTEMGLLTTLTNLNMAKNELDGPLPSEIGKLTNLQTLNLIDTDLSGTIPTQLGGMAALKTLNLDDNDLYGEIPTQFGLLTNLFNISLSLNLLDGPIPTQLGLCTKMTDIRFSDNGFEGEIPVQLFSLTGLKVLELDDNEMEGTIPTQIGLLTALTRLELDDNELTGDVPALPSSLVGGKCQLENNDLDNEDNADALECDT